MTERIRRLSELAKKERHASVSEEALREAIRMRQSDGDEPFAAIRHAFASLVKFTDDDMIAGNQASLFFLWRKEVPYPSLDPVYSEYKDLYNTLIMNGGNHNSPNYAAVIDHGMKGILARIEESRNAHQGDTEKIGFLDDLSYAANAVIAFARGHADAAEAEAEKTQDPWRREELLRMAKVCRQVPENSARSFFEAVQSYFFVYLMFPDGVASLDRYLEPYYQKDLSENRITRDEALELIENLFINIFGIIGPNHEWSGMTHGVLAGYNADGECTHNACTSLILEATAELPLWRPQFSYRVTAKTTDEQLLEAIEAHCRRPDLILFLNDDVLVPNLTRLGVPYHDAIRYSVSGCNELILTGCSQTGALEGHINVVTALERLMCDRERLMTISSFDELYAAYEEELKKDLDCITKLSYDRDRVTAEFPKIPESLFTDGCIENAVSLTAGGALYNFCTWCLSGIVNAADSFTVLAQTVFTSGTHTLAEWSDCLSENWNGHEELHQDALACTHFGSGDFTVDAMINRIAGSVNRLTADQVPFRGGRYLFGTLTGYELAHVVLGKNTGATPDGRHSGDPFAASIAAYPGSEKNGVTGYLASAAQLDGNYLQTSVVVNLALDKTMCSTKEKRVRLAALLRTYFSLGGVQLQINYLSADELRCAQKNPDDYRSLRVRVTGFSGFFTTFDKSLQDELINRTLLGG